MDCSSGVVRAEGVVWGLEEGNSNPKSLLSAVRTATTFKDQSAKDFKGRNIISSVLFRFAALVRLTELCPPLLYHFACQRSGECEVVDGQADTGYLCSRYRL